MILSVFMAVMIMASVMTPVLEPLVSDLPQVEQMIWFVLDGFFSILFTIELLLRFIVTNALGKQTHLDFAKNPMNIADFVAVLPWYIDVITMGLADASES